MQRSATTRAFCVDSPRFNGSRNRSPTCVRTAPFLCERISEILSGCTVSKLTPYGRDQTAPCPEDPRPSGSRATRRLRGRSVVTRGLRWLATPRGYPASPAGARPGRPAYLGEGVLDGELVGGNSDGRETRDERLLQSRVGRRLEEREEVSGPVVPQRFSKTAGKELQEYSNTTLAKGTSQGRDLQRATRVL